MDIKTPHPAVAPGDLDPDFGDAGIFDLKFGDGISIGSASCVALAPDERIYVVGGTPDRRYALARLNPDGSPDDTFGTHGVTTGRFGAYMSWATSLLFLPDGRLVLAGEADAISYQRTGLACLNPDGTLDQGFGTNGWVILTPPTVANRSMPPPSSRTSSATQSSGVKPRSIGWIHAGGKIRVTDYQNFQAFIYSLNLDGSLDTGFGGNGYIILDNGSPYVWLNALYDLSSKMVAVGHKTDVATGSGHPFMARFNADGGPDKNFGTKGELMITALVGEFVDIALSANGNMVGVGQVLFEDPNRALLMGRLQDGSPNLAFNNGEPVFTSLENASCDWSSGTVIPGTQRIAVTGTLHTQPSAAIIARFNGDGTSDTSFGASGIARLKLEGHTRSDVIVAQTDQKLVVGGQVIEPGASYGFVARYIG